jgi:signal transduction histidine kinase/DNA-binding response OmpR family regulator/ligand-binding sensor domain-containing protein
LFLAWLLSCSHNGFTRQPFAPPRADPIAETWRWQPVEFLSAKGIRSMTDDQAGHMWFGLDKGILWYDGINWKTFDKKDFLKSPVTSLLVSDRNEILAGNESGLLQFNGVEWEKIFPAEDSIDVAVSCIRQLADGSLAIGIQNGMLHINNGKQTIYTVHARMTHFRLSHPEAKIIVLPDEVLFQRSFGRVDEIFIGADGRVWMLMSRNNDGKLLQFNYHDTIQGVLQKYRLSDKLGENPISNKSLYKKTRDGTEWLINGFYKSGILTRHETQWELLKLSDFFGGDELHTSILELSDGSLLLGGLGKLYVFKDNQWRVFTASSLPIPSSRIILHESRDANVWVAGIQGDVFKLSYGDQQWKTYRGLNHHYTDSTGNEWFISSAGLIVVKEKDNWFSYGQQHGLIDSPVKLTATSNGRIWVAGSHQGMAATAFLEGETWIKQLHPALSWGIDPRSVFQSNDGSLWFGASVDRQETAGHLSGVLQAFNPDDHEIRWKHHTQQDGITQHNAYGIGQSPDGFIWLGGTNLLRFDSNRWRQIPDNEYFNDFVDIVYSRQNLWVGSRYYGLFSFDGTKWKHFTTNDGLPSNTIISVFEESQESVWVITDKAIARYDGLNWQAGVLPAEFQIAREGGEISVSHDGAIWVNKASREWKRRAFPFSITPTHAFDEFWTIKYTRENTPPQTVIHLFSEHVDQSGNTLIGWTGKDYWNETPATSLTFSYRLNDEAWSAFTPETSVVYTNLRDGRYTFQVRARDLNFNIEQNPATIVFFVRPPIWKQAWFIAFVIAVLVIIGWYETRLIQRNRSLFRLNLSLKNVNQTLEIKAHEIEFQKEQILSQKEELERKTHTLEEKNTEIVKQRDQLSEMIEKVEELSRVKTRFFTNISHEFRTPLTLIIGSIEQLLTTREPDKNKLNRAYDMIQRNTRRILRLINQILEIRKIETGKLSLDASPGDFNNFVSQIVLLFQDLAADQSLSLQLTASPPRIPALFDHDKMEKILFNLISNAFKSTPAGGIIQVDVRIIGRTDAGEPQFDDMNSDHDQQEWQCKPAPPDFLQVTVSDNGDGIPAASLERIFERFYQVDKAANQRKYDSSGIGLSYVKDLVEAHNGSIMVQSKPGEGATFIIRVPYFALTTGQVIPGDMHLPTSSTRVSDSIRQEIEQMSMELHHSHTNQPGLAEEPDRKTDAPDKTMVLIVEDEYELRGFIRKILDKDFHVIEAVNGRQGLEKALALQPDLIITDVMMPEMDGNELCHELKNHLATNHIPVIMLTAQAAPENKLEGYQTGADAYLEKPFNTQFLNIRINNLLQAQQKTRDKIMRDLITQPREIIVYSEDDKILRKIQEVLEKNVSNPEFDVESLSQQFCLSRFHFSRKIKQITGLSPKEIIDSFRLKRAGQLLQQQKLPVSEVAYMVGFDHPNSFSRAFRKYYNMTPTEFASQN